MPTTNGKIISSRARPRGRHIFALTCRGIRGDLRAHLGDSARSVLIARFSRRPPWGLGLPPTGRCSCTAPERSSRPGGQRGLDGPARRARQGGTRQGDRRAV